MMETRSDLVPIAGGEQITTELAVIGADGTPELADNQGLNIGQDYIHDVLDASHLIDPAALEQATQRILTFREFRVSLAEYMEQNSLTPFQIIYCLAEEAGQKGVAQAAAWQLVFANSPFIIQQLAEIASVVFARRARYTAEDLFGEVCSQLAKKAVNEFDPEKGDFATFIKFKLRRVNQEMAAEQAGTLSLPVEVWRLNGMVRAALAYLQEHHLPTGLSVILEHIRSRHPHYRTPGKLTPERLLGVIGAPIQADSLEFRQAQFGDAADIPGKSETGSNTADDNHEGRLSTIQALADFLAAHGKGDQFDVLLQFYGVGTGEPLSLGEIARRSGRPLSTIKKRYESVVKFLGRPEVKAAIAATLATGAVVLYRKTRENKNKAKD